MAPDLSLRFNERRINHHDCQLLSHRAQSSSCNRALQTVQTIISRVNVKTKQVMTYDQQGCIGQQGPPNKTQLPLQAHMIKQAHTHSLMQQSLQFVSRCCSPRFLLCFTITWLFLTSTEVVDAKALGILYPFTSVLYQFCVACPVRALAVQGFCHQGCEKAGWRLGALVPSAPYCNDAVVDK